MGALRKAGIWLGLVEDDDDREYERAAERRYGSGANDRYRSDDELYDAEAEYADDQDFDGEYTEEYVAPRSRPERQTPRASSSDRVSSRGSISPITAARAGSNAQMHFGSEGNVALAPQIAVKDHMSSSEGLSDSPYRITTLHPTTYNEARTIGEHYRNNIPVIINLTEMDESDAKRLVDFAAGLAFGLRGSIERVTNRVFLLSPANVTVTAEDRAKIAEGGFFNQS